MPQSTTMSVVHHFPTRPPTCRYGRFGDVCIIEPDLVIGVVGQSSSIRVSRVIRCGHA